MEDKQPLLTPIMRWFMFAMVLANIAGTMYTILLPIYLTELGASITQVGLVFSLSSVVILILQIFGGWLSDSIGRLRAIAIGSVGGVIGFTFMLLANSWPTMLMAIAVNQIPYAFVGPSFGAFIAENSTQENRGRVYGITETIYQITGVVGPPLGGYIAGVYGFKPMLLVATIFYTFAAGLRIWMATTMRSPDEPTPEKLTRGSFKNSFALMIGMILSGGVVTWIFVTDGVRDIAFLLSDELLPLYLEQIAGISLVQIGLLGSIFSISMMFTPLLSGRISDRYGERVPISAGFLMIFFAYLIFLQAGDYIGFAITWAIFGVSVGLLSPAYQSLISKVVPQKNLGIFTGMFRSSMGFISLPAPYIGAQLWERFNPRIPFILTALLAGISVIPTWFKFKLPEEGSALGTVPLETVAGTGENPADD
ncbi:MAG: MFS transporter [Chloroflexota bacterium]|nr:MAG: MFS transporter [Chloroflexota bacterium]